MPALGTGRKDDDTHKHIHVSWFGIISDDRMGQSTLREAQSSVMFRAEIQEKH